MKRIFKLSVAALAVGTAVTLAGCGGCTSCSGNTANSTVTNSNWYTGTSYKGIQPSFIAENGYEDYKEIITYGVSFDKETAKNSSYSADYKEGVYTTEFYAVNYSWKNSYKDYISEKTELVYCFKTDFSIEVKYTLKSGGETEWFKDSVITECYFRPAGKSLQPIYSRQEIKSTSPNKAKAKKLEDAYKRIDVVYENYYSPDCKEVTCITAEAGKETTEKLHSFKKVKNSLFDNASLYIAVRSMKLSTDYSQTVSVFNAAAGGASSYAVSGSAKELAEPERKEITAALVAKNLYSPKELNDDNGNPVEDKGINSVAMNINYTGGKLTGTTQTVWYAAIENESNNVSRATMLKISIPLSYNLGTLNYTLKEIVSTLWNA